MLLATTTHYVDWIVFVLAALIAVAGSIGVVTSRHPVHSVLFLIQTLFGVAILFVAQGAHFLAAVQVIVYAGAIVVLFLFVIMLLGVDRAEARAADPFRGQRPMALLVGVIGLAQFGLLLRSATWSTGAKSVAGPLSGPGSNVEKLGRSLFTTYLLPFEVTSALLVIAVVAAVILTKRPPSGEADGEAEDLDTVDTVEPASAPSPTADDVKV
jgi:NADH-quinone oxidoreductase subunit J